LLLLSIYLLLRGHNDPGGGFIGGLVAASAYALFAIAHGVEPARQVLRIKPRILIAMGLTVAVASAGASLFIFRPFMTGLWSDISIASIGKIGTPLFFDIGVYLVVLGVSLLIIFTLAED
jgi:multicomponent Na+:H+ antiporter subunit B